MDERLPRVLLDDLRMYQEMGLPIIPCNGKIPSIKNWTSRGKPTLEEIHDWLQAYSNMNIGLVLGQASGLIGIDVDGQRGAEILEELSQGILPTTWQFSTPSGGMRYLYCIPPNETNLKKFTRSDPNEEHSECALLGEGQMTIMPPSTSADTGIPYEWINQPETTQIAEAPGWMVSLMKKDKSRARSPSPAIKTLANLRAKCPTFNEDWITQKEHGLDENTWFLWISLLEACGYHEAAVSFSKASFKHNERSIERLEKLKKDNKKEQVQCLTLGCNEKQVRKCFSNDVRTNDYGEIKNSPGFFLIQQQKQRNQPKQWTQSELKQIGFRFSKNGGFAGVNGNIFARHLLQQQDLLYVAAGERFFL